MDRADRAGDIQYKLFHFYFAWTCRQSWTGWAFNAACSWFSCIPHIRIKFEAASIALNQSHQSPRRGAPSQIPQYLQAVTPYGSIWGFPEIGVPPKSSMLVGFPIINHPKISKNEGIPIGHDHISMAQLRQVVALRALRVWADDVCWNGSHAVIVEVTQYIPI